jgi:acetyltransferase
MPGDPAPTTAARIDSGDRSRAIDALRGVAALSVLVFHTGGLTGANPPAAGLGHVLDRNLDSGLVLFFVLSGYVISRPFVNALVDGRPMPDLRRYAMRRACRILPAFWVALAAVILFVHGTRPVPGAAPLRAWWQVPLHALLLQDFVPGQFQGLLKVAWTLENELFFYALVPLAALLVARRFPAGIRPGRLAGMVLALWAASAVVTLAADQLPAFTDGAAVARYTFPAVVGLFCPGILVAIARTRAAGEAGGGLGALPRLWSRPRRWAPVVLGTLVLALVTWQAEVSLGRGHVVLLDQHWQVFAAGFGLLLGGVLAGGRHVEAASRPLAVFGTVSYGIYLWHTVVIHGVSVGNLGVTGARAGLLALPFNVLLVAVLTLPLAAASWFVVERPALRWAATWGTRSVAEPEPVPVPAITG